MVGNNDRSLEVVRFVEHVSADSNISSFTTLLLARCRQACSGMVFLEGQKVILSFLNSRQLTEDAAGGALRSGSPQCTGFWNFRKSHYQGYRTRLSTQNSTFRFPVLLSADCRFWAQQGPLRQQAVLQKRNSFDASALERP